jgi:hypothetical protein
MEPVRPASTESQAIKQGVIDRFEGDLAVVVLDDDQQVRWPLATLPPGCRPGVAVRLQLVAGAVEAAVGSRRPVRVRRAAQTAEWELQLDDGSTLTWPASGQLSATAAGPFSLMLTSDPDDTAARRRRVRGLVDDIFGA